MKGDTKVINYLNKLLGNELVAMASAVMPTKYKMCNSMVLSLKICLAG